MRYAFAFTTQPAPGPHTGPPCRRHGLPCRTPWGWDRDHTDSDQPYTLAELEHREDCPHFHAYPTMEAYEQGFYLWRAIRRDERLNDQEAAARMAAVEQRIRSLMTDERHQPWNRA